MVFRDKQVQDLNQWTYSRLAVFSPSHFSVSSSDQVLPLMASHLGPKVDLQKRPSLLASSLWTLIYLSPCTEVVPL